MVKVHAFKGTAKMQKKTVAIIIDNKSRELLSATLIAMELAKRIIFPQHRYLHGRTIVIETAD